jgi:hypothetical protein
MDDFRQGSSRNTPTVRSNICESYLDSATPFFLGDRSFILTLPFWALLGLSRDLKGQDFIQKLLENI